ncbi:MAG: alanine--glyoxylate aminotransferase family protein [Desulfotignum sp.]|nr:alanine--glyoxylate aminotransferase family protein [Desulfotignum sp.]
MTNLLQTIEPVTLMGPGPSCVPSSVLDALSKPTLGHLDPDFIQIMDAIKQQLKTLLHTENALTLPISGTGSAGMECCFVNLIEKDDPVLILINGVFGQRMQDVATRLGADVDTLEFDWGKPVIVDVVQKQLSEKSYKLVAVVHAETSTGVMNPVSGIGSLLKDSDTLFLVDAVTSFGGTEILMDDWGIDVLYSGTQKCLSCPPGLSPVSFSPAAVVALQSRKTKVPNWYLDLSLIMNYWEGATRAYHHTAPINMLYGLYQALCLILDEGEARVFDRHLETHHLLVRELDRSGMRMQVDASCRLPMLNAVCVPDGVNDAEIRTRLLREYKIEIGGGLGPLAGKIWRIGLMGHTARPENVEKLIQALKEILPPLRDR